MDKVVKDLMALSDEDFVTELRAMKQKHIEEKNYGFDKFTLEDYNLIMKRASPLVLTDPGEFTFFEEIKFRLGLT